MLLFARPKLFQSKLVDKIFQHSYIKNINLLLPKFVTTIFTTILLFTTTPSYNLRFYKHFCTTRFLQPQGKNFPFVQPHNNSKPLENDNFRTTKISCKFIQIIFFYFSRRSDGAVVAG